MIVNEVFTSIQGEGPNVGTLSTFIRFAKCNLACSWCDTDYRSGVEMSDDELLKLLREQHYGERLVFTGGEPTLWVTPKLCERVRSETPIKLIDFETNGVEWNDSLLWASMVVVSPKTLSGWWPKVSERLPGRNCVKVVYDTNNRDLVDIMRTAEDVSRELFLQPLEIDGETNAREVVEFIHRNPQWRLSLQTHKILGVR